MEGQWTRTELRLNSCRTANMLVRDELRVRSTQSVPNLRQARPGVSIRFASPANGLSDSMDSPIGSQPSFASVPTKQTSPLDNFAKMAAASRSRTCRCDC